MNFPCYLTHPKNGAHIAYDAGEVERLTQWYGWEIAKPSAVLEAQVVQVETEAPKKRGPGRPRKAK